MSSQILDLRQRSASAKGLLGGRTPGTIERPPQKAEPAAPRTSTRKPAAKASTKKPAAQPGAERPQKAAAIEVLEPEAPVTVVAAAPVAAAAGGEGPFRTKVLKIDVDPQTRERWRNRVEAVIPSFPGNAVSVALAKQLECSDADLLTAVLSTPAAGVREPIGVRVDPDTYTAWTTRLRDLGGLRQTDALSAALEAALDLDDITLRDAVVDQRRRAALKRLSSATPQ